MKFDFLEFIKQDDIIQNYTLHAITIHTEVINNNDTLDISKLGQVGTFPMIVVISSGYIDIIYYYILGRYNFLTKKSTLGKAIVGLKDKGSITEIKDLEKGTISKEKMPKLDKLYQISMKKQISKLSANQ